VESLVLRGVFLLTERELAWFYQDGACMMFPDAWARFCAPRCQASRGGRIHARRAVHRPGAAARRPARPADRQRRRPAALVNVYLNDEDVRFLSGLETPVKDGDTVTVLPAVAGGAL